MSLGVSIEAREANSPLAAVSARCGLVAGGNWIVDRVKVIDAWPSQDGLASILQQSHSNGGSPYNVLKDLALLGADFPLTGIGRVGDDSDGRFILDDCRRHGIDVTQLRATPATATSYTDVMTVEATGRRTFFHQRGANALLTADDFDFSRCTARRLHLGYLLLLDRLDELDGKGSSGAAEVLRRARAAGLQTSLDCVSTARGDAAAAAAPVLPHVDVLFANELETQMLTGVSLENNGIVDRSAVARSARQLLSAEVREWVCVHFPAGVLAVNREGAEVWQPSVRVPAAAIRGAAGAGDALAAGVLFGLHEGWAMPECLRLGVCAAAACLHDVSCSGGIRPVPDSLRLGERFGWR